MARLILLIAFAIVIILAWKKLQGLSGADRKKYLWQVLAVAGGAVLVLLVVTGRLHWIGAAVAAAIPLLRRILPLALPFLHHLRPGLGRRQPDNAQQSSTVSSAILKMQLDHSSGKLDGEVVDGPSAGRQLSALDEGELLSLYQYCCQQDQDSARLLASYLDQRLNQDWRNASQENSSAQDQGSMSRAEALAVLGLDGEADEQAIVQAHRQLMQKLHPDRGGNDYLAAQLNRARDTLLS